MIGNVGVLLKVDRVDSLIDYTNQNLDYYPIHSGSDEEKPAISAKFASAKNIIV